MNAPPLLVKVWRNAYANELVHSRRLYSLESAIRETKRLGILPVKFVTQEQARKLGAKEQTPQ